MKVQEAHEFLKQLMDEGKGDLPMFTEYERLYNMTERVADDCCDGSSSEMEPGTPFVLVDLDHR